MLKLHYTTDPQTGIRIAPSWQEILAFSRATLRVIGPAECELLHAMSRSYLTGVVVGEKPLGLEPYKNLAFDDNEGDI